MNKKLLILLAIAIMALPLASACGRIAATGITTLPAPKIPHPVDVRFANCNACHVADQLKATKPLPHSGIINYDNKSCISLACHQPSTGTTTTTPPTTSTTPPTSPTGTGTTTGTAPPSSSTAALLTLPDVPVALTTHNLSAVQQYQAAGLCLFCHAAGGTNPQPTTPTWNGKTSGSTHFTGIDSVPAGSKADHTGYTNATDCFQ